MATHLKVVPGQAATITYVITAAVGEARVYAMSTSCSINSRRKVETRPSQPKCEPNRILPDERATPPTFVVVEVGVDGYSNLCPLK